jgi:pimeloyl-ACP methyl ester carboxylesterase
MTPDPLKYAMVHANGLQFEVAQQGSGDKLALLLHGFPELAFSWRNQVPVLADLGYTVWAPNQRGYGNSDKPPRVPDYDMTNLMADVTALIHAAGFETCLLVGHDWGGVVAWSVARHHPELLEGLVIMNAPHPACFLRELKTWRQLKMSWYMGLFQLPWLPERYMAADRAARVARAFKGMTTRRENFPPEVLDVYRDAAARPGAMKAMINWYRAGARSIRRAGRQPGLRVIDTPTLMIWGEQDKALSIETTYGTDDYVSDLQLRYLPNASHWVQQDEPGEVNRLLTEWITGHLWQLPGSG